MIHRWSWIFNSVIDQHESTRCLHYTLLLLMAFYIKLLWTSCHTICQGFLVLVYFFLLDFQCITLCGLSNFYLTFLCTQLQHTWFSSSYSVNGLLEFLNVSGHNVHIFLSVCISVTWSRSLHFSLNFFLHSTN